MILTFYLVIQLSPLADMFISWCQDVAQADPLALDFDSYGIKFVETKPFNDSFNKNGSESSTFILLMGGLLTLKLLIPVVYIVKIGLRKVIFKYQRYWIVRKIG